MTRASLPANSLEKLQELLNRAVEHHRAGRLAEAEALCRQVLTTAPKNLAAIRLSGDVAYKLGRTLEAIDLLNRALEIDPQSAAARMGLGLALIAAGRRAEAEVQLREAVLRKPDFVEAWDNLAISLRVQDRMAAARKSAAWKVAVATHLKSTTDVSNGWLATQLDMGTAAYVSKHVGLLQRGGGPGKKGLEQLQEVNDET
jgi:predicted Zn-dependent protease